MIILSRAAQAQRNLPCVVVGAAALTYWMVSATFQLPTIKPKMCVSTNGVGTHKPPRMKKHRKLKLQKERQISRLHRLPCGQALALASIN